ncbi:hypothetical protein [Nostoc sp. 'Peltigera malacea cyanobiont' DB3992]|uniref:hypothetical protein n=1 Tax=Nostoc sp. 'Peltigera malacea cyanobiont' DB3992 TaxID=1206980 RepID=UPI00211EFDEE|nr:hypothetical protein [Nostoc sp. 'Peltigera malacea cyanobiont' DB3992]
MTAGAHHKQAPVFQPEVSGFAISRFDLEFANTTEAYGSDRNASEMQDMSQVVLLLNWLLRLTFLLPIGMQLSKSG